MLGLNEEEGDSLKSTGYLSVTLVLIAGALMTAPARADDSLVPGNDNFANATVIQAVPFSDEYAQALATPEPFEPTCVGNQSVWYAYTPSADHTVIADTYPGGNGGGTAIGVFTGGSRFRDLTQVYCSDYYEPAIAVVQVKAGSTYYFQVGTAALIGDVFTITFNLNIVGSIQGTVVDQFGSPISGVIVEIDFQGSNFYSYRFDVSSRTDAEGRYVMPVVRPGIYRLVFYPTLNDYFAEIYDERPGVYSYPPPEFTPVEVSSGQTLTIDEDLIRSGKITGKVTDEAGMPLAGICVGAHDAEQNSTSSGSATDQEGIYVLHRISTGNHYVHFRPCSTTSAYASEWYSNADDLAEAAPVSVVLGSVTSGIDAAMARVQFVPPNDSMADATVVASLPFEETTNTLLASNQVGEPQCGNASKTVWYEVTPSEGGVISVDARSSDFTPVIGVYTATGLDTDSGTLNYSAIACESNSPSKFATTSFNASSGTRYWIQIGAKYGGGRVSISIQREEIAPANDNLNDADEINSLPYVHSVRTHAATMEEGESPFCDPVNRATDPVHTVDHGHSVWYTVTPETSGTLNADTRGSNFNTVLAVYKKSSLDAGNKFLEYESIACANNGSYEGTYSYQASVSFQVSAGTTYYIQLVGYWGDSGVAKLSVSGL